MEKLSYKSYLGSIEYSLVDKLYFGQIINTDNLISYEGKTTQCLSNDFQIAVDQYIEDSLR